MRDARGITLIALIVTIIVLLILAGVSIQLTIGENGIINRAKEAKMKTEIASIKEEIQTDILEKQAGSEGEISESELKTILEKYGTLNYEEDETTIIGITTTKGGYEISINDIWTGITNNEESEPIFTTVANAPDISGFNKNNTCYVAWDLTSSPYEIKDDRKINGIAPSNWYDYTAGVNKWANIKTTGGGNDCYWVWIPRYAYKIPTRSSTAQTIEIAFLKGIGTSVNDVIDEEKRAQIQAAGGFKTTNTPGNWVIHPAFTNTGTVNNGGFGELTGIWVAKFEASSSAVSEETLESDLNGNGGGNVTNLNVRIKPNVTSWCDIIIGNMFNVFQNMITTGNSLENTNNIDSHMIKNTEWGAVAYLSRSIYGKNSPVWNNSYYNGTTYYSSITGLCGNNQDASQTTLIDTYRYNEDIGENKRGANASTTGNVYGVYDMAGGAIEYVAGVLSSKLSNSNYDFSSVNAKYYDSYSSYNNTKYGDAVYETSTSSTGNTSWDSGRSMFLNSEGAVFNRGEHPVGGSTTGIFSYNIMKDSVAGNGKGFRPCLVSPQL